MIKEKKIHFKRVKKLINKMQEKIKSWFYFKPDNSIFSTILTLILLGIFYFSIIYFISMSYLSIYK